MDQGCQKKKKYKEFAKIEALTRHVKTAGWYHYMLICTYSAFFLLCKKQRTV